MELKTYAESLANALDVASINKFFQSTRKTTETVLKKLRPEGVVSGNRFKLASLEGGQGNSFDFNLDNHQWGDWGKGNVSGSQGLVSFVEGTQRCSTAQAVQWLIDEKYLNKKEAKKAISAEDGDPLLLPIPEDQQSWEIVLEAMCLKRDRGIITDHWEYRDTDNTLLGYKYRVDDRSSAKEVFTLTYRAESGWTKKSWDKKSIPPYGLEQLTDGPTTRVLFVEGEKAARKAREIFKGRWKVLSFSGVAASSILWLPDDEIWSDCEVVIWPDNDLAGRDASRKIILLLGSLTNKPREIRVVRVEALPGLPPKWDLGDYDESCPVDPNVEIERAEQVDSFEHVSRSWVYVSQTEQFYNLDNRSLIWSPSGFDRHFYQYRDKSGSASQKFLQDTVNKKAVDLDFVPGEGTFLFNDSGEMFLNEWFPTRNYSEAIRIANDPMVTDAEIAQKAQYFIAHLARIAGDEIVEQDYDQNTKEPIPGTEERPLLDALSYHFSLLVQRPMDKRGWIPMLVSEENGTGKSYFKEAMGAVIGQSRARTVTVKEFTADYDDWADGLLFYELGEAKSQDNTDVYEKLKKLHNNKPFSIETLSDRDSGKNLLNIKTKAKKAQRDFLNGMITANDLFPLALANSSGQEGSDRRLLVINPRHILTEMETEQLFDDELKFRAPWIGAYLLRFKPRCKWNLSWAPITAHKRLMMEKDRTRSENRSDKYELGRYDQFYHMIGWALSEGIGAMRRKVFTGEQVRGIAEANKVSFPYEVTKFESILKKAGVLTGIKLKIDGAPRTLYTTDPEMLEKSVPEWREELTKPLNERGA